MKRQELGCLLPKDVMWGDPITPGIVKHIATSAKTANQDNGEPSVAKEQALSKIAKAEKGTDMSNETLVLGLRAKIRELELAEDGAKEAFGRLVQQKRDLEAERNRLRGLLDASYASIRLMGQVPN